MISKTFGLFDFIEITNWYEIYDFQKPIDYNIFANFIKNYELDFDTYKLNTIFNMYSDKLIYLKVGIDLKNYNTNYCCGINFWINEHHIHIKYMVPYNTLGQIKTMTNDSIPTRIKNYYKLNSDTIFYYMSNK